MINIISSDHRSELEIASLDNKKNEIKSFKLRNVFRTEQDWHYAIFQV